MTHYRYTVVEPNGHVEKLRIPSVFDPFDVAEKLHHSEVFMHVPRGHHVWVENARGLGGMVGPIVVYVGHDRNHYHVPNAPRTDGEATELLRGIAS